MSLSLADVTLTYPDGDSSVTALEHIDLQVADGELAVVVGPSGSGKSSLLAVASTLVHPSSGRVRIGGRSVDDLSEDDRAQLRRRELGIIFQQPNLVPSLTAREQLVLMSVLDAGRARQARNRADELLERVGLEGLGSRRPSQLSGGQLQRINVARALMNHPSVLLVDEPTSSLDNDRGATIMELLRDLTREDSTATVLVTHDVRHVRHDDRILRLEDGRLSETTVAPGSEDADAHHRRHRSASPLTV